MLQANIALQAAKDVMITLGKILKFMGVLYSSTQSGTSKIMREARHIQNTLHVSLAIRLFDTNFMAPNVQLTLVRF